jgi:hypothetical protein
MHPSHATPKIMPIQTTYGYSYTNGIQGMPYDLTPSYDVTAECGTAIDFGVGLVIDSTRTPSENRIGVKLPDGSGNIFAGISVYDRAQQVNSGTPASLSTLTTTEGTQYPASEAIRMRKRGRIRVYSEQAVNPSLPVYLRYTVNGGLTVGNFRVDADTSKALLISNASWVSTTTAAGIAVVEINLP